MAPDVLIVGGGSAGCVLAARLSEDPARRVLLLEAGPEARDRRIEIPLAFFKLLGSELDWAFRTAPDPTSDGRTHLWPRGRVLGGSSAINAMIYMRGHDSDFDHWAEVAHPRWGARSVLRLFRKSEDQLRGASDRHGVGGPLSVSDPRSPRDVSRAFVKACTAAGLPANPDFNGERQEGAGLYQLTQRRGRRASTEAAFLRPVRGRANLEVRTGLEVARLLFEGERVIGVEAGGERFEAGEVILAAGAVGSPLILMRSGVGPASELEAVGIAVREDRPGVGSGLQDHPVVPLCWKNRTGDTLDRAERRPLLPLLDWTVRRRGMLTSNVAEAGAFLRVDAAAPAPDIQFHFAPAFLLDHGFQNPPGSGFTCGVTLVRPESRGVIRLSPDGSPSIDHPYWSAPSDMQRMVAGMRKAAEIISGPAMERWRGDPYLPVDPDASDADLAGHVRQWGQTLYHPTSTCRMGSDTGAVVDPELRVRGVPGLRIADASVMPRIVNCNTNASTIMIAEMAAELVAGLEPLEEAE